MYIKGEKIMRGYIIEAQGVFYGVEVMVIIQPKGHRCGYAKVHERNPLFNVDYNDIHGEPNVNGGLTFSDHSENMSGDFPKGYWLGFDANHSWDTREGGQSLATMKKDCEALAMFINSKEKDNE